MGKTLACVRTISGYTLLLGGAAGMATWSFAIDSTFGHMPGHLLNQTLRDAARTVVSVPALPWYGMVVLGNRLLGYENI